MMENDNEEKHDKEDDGDDDGDGDDSDSKNNTGKNKSPKWISRRHASSLLIDSELAIQKAVDLLKEANELAQRAGLSVDSRIIPKSAVAASAFNNIVAGGGDTSSLDPYAIIGVNAEQQSQKQHQNVALATTKASNLFGTGGHSNTDHVVLMTGDERTDRVAELKRNMLRRHRAMQPENRGEYRWDKPRIPGERRRRIVHERDLPQAPPEPPSTGFILFVGQMTTKIRHDRGPDVPHDQTKTVQEIGNMWKMGMSDEERQYYNTCSNEAREEYEKQFIEYRATGSFKPNKNYKQLEGSNVWVKSNPDLQNSLEKEICGYDTVLFPKRPPSQEEEYRERDIRSKFRRKLKLRGMLNEDGTVKDGYDDFETLLAKDRKEREEQKQQAAAGVPPPPKPKRKRKPRKRKQPPQQPQEQLAAVTNGPPSENSPSSNQMQEQQGEDEEPTGKGESELENLHDGSTSKLNSSSSSCPPPAAAATSKESKTPPASKVLPTMSEDNDDGEDQTDTTKTVDDASVKKKRRKLDEEIKRDERPPPDDDDDDGAVVTKQKAANSRTVIHRASASSSTTGKAAATQASVTISTSLEEENDGEERTAGAVKKGRKVDEDVEGQEKAPGEDSVTTKKNTKKRRKVDGNVEGDGNVSKNDNATKKKTKRQKKMPGTSSSSSAPGADTKAATAEASKSLTPSLEDNDEDEIETTKTAPLFADGEGKKFRSGNFKAVSSDAVTKKKTSPPSSQQQKEVSGGASPRRRSSSRTSNTDISTTAVQEKPKADSDDDDDFYNFSELMAFNRSCLNWLYMRGGKLHTYKYVVGDKAGPIKGKAGIDFFHEENEVIDYCRTMDYKTKYADLYDKWIEDGQPNNCRRRSGGFDTAKDWTDTGKSKHKK